METGLGTRKPLAQVGVVNFLRPRLPILYRAWVVGSADFGLPEALLYGIALDYLLLPNDERLCAMGAYLPRLQLFNIEP